MPRHRANTGPRAPPPLLAGLFCISIIFFLIFSIIYSMYTSTSPQEGL
jgi:p-aminobenzoyl-glutamate transporter AbgT